MRLTLILNHVKRHYWGKGWGQKPGRDTTIRMFKIQWRAKSKRKIFECNQSLPPNVTVEDANEFVKTCLRQELCENKEPTPHEKVFPWPYSQRPLKGFIFIYKYLLFI